MGAIWSGCGSMGRADEWAESKGRAASIDVGTSCKGAEHEHSHRKSTKENNHHTKSNISVDNVGSLIARPPHVFMKMAESN
jgi:hypothetical protein